MIPKAPILFSLVMHRPIALLATRYVYGSFGYLLIYLVHMTVEAVNWLIASISAFNV